jgi:hypothetical protein
MKKMTSEQFAALKTSSKWKYITSEMDDIQSAETAFSLRRRFNPHHPADVVRKETTEFRLAQWARWCAVKDLYAEHRDEMSKTDEISRFINAKELLERIFTQELDEALRSTLEE